MKYGPRRSERTRPPTRVSDSRSTVSQWRSRHPAAKPEIPPPTITTSFIGAVLLWLLNDVDGFAVSRRGATDTWLCDFVASASGWSSDDTLSSWCSGVSLGCDYRSHKPGFLLGSHRTIASTCAATGIAGCAT